MSTPILVPDRTDYVDLNQPGTPNLDSWRGTMLFAPWVYDNTAVDGYYYLYFTSEKATTNPSLGSTNYCIGVARSTTYAGPWEYCNSDAPILSPSEVEGEWGGADLSCGSVLDNPFYGDANPLEFNGNFIVEFIFYLDSAITDTNPYLWAMYNSEGTAVAWIRLYNTGTSSRRLIAGVLVGGVAYETENSQYVEPKAAVLNYVSFSYNSTPATNQLQIFLNKSSSNASGVRLKTCGGAGTTIDSCVGGTFDILPGAVFSNKLHVRSVRVKSVPLAYTLIEAAAYVGPYGTPGTVMANGYFLETENTVYLHNMAAGDTTQLIAVEGYPTDIHFGKMKNEAHRTVVARQVGLTYTTDKGLSRTATGQYMRLYGPSSQKYMMTVAGTAWFSTNNGSYPVYFYYDIMGYAYSDSLDSGWTLSPVHALNEMEGEALIPVSEYGSITHYYGTGDVIAPKLFLGHDDQYFLIFSRNQLTDVWGYGCVMREMPKEQLFAMPKKYRILHKGNVDSEEFDMAGVVSAHVITDATARNPEPDRIVMDVGDGVNTQLIIDGELYVAPTYADSHDPSVWTPPSYDPFSYPPIGWTPIPSVNQTAGDWAYPIDSKEPDRAFGIYDIIPPEPGTLDVLATFEGLEPGTAYSVGVRYGGVDYVETVTTAGVAGSFAGYGYFDQIGVEGIYRYGTNSPPDPSTAAITTKYFSIHQVREEEIP